MLIPRTGYNWNNGLSPNWWAYNRVGLLVGGLITVILQYFGERVREIEISITPKPKYSKIPHVKFYRCLLYQDSK